MSETHEVTITRVLPKEGKRPAKIMTEEGHEPTTFKDEIVKQAEALVGKRAKLAISTVQKGEYTNHYLEGVEALPENGNGSAPMVATRAVAAPQDAERMARSVAWKTMGGDVFKAVLSAHSVQTNQQMTPQNVLDLARRVTNYITTDILGDESVPF